MTVAELIEELQALPATAKVEVEITCNLIEDWLAKLEEPRTVAVVSVVYEVGFVSLVLDE